MDWLTICLLGFLSAEIASFNSASSLAFFCAFTSSVPLADTLLEITFRGLSFSAFSPCGIRSSPKGSLASRLRPGMAAGVADLIRANGSTVLREALRLCWSLSKSLSSDFGALAATGLFAADPGFAKLPVTMPADAFFDFGGDAASGPPSFLLRSAHSSGSRPAKLVPVSACSISAAYRVDLQWHDYVNAEVLQRI